MLRTLKLAALITSAALIFGPATGVWAQQAPAPEDSFASENAVLDTSILLSIGAREARQELRGAFGWPTFQEGLVEGVYFRFDPDGYARFAPSPRLDTDVFEVICRPRTHICMGRKDSLQVTLNNRGQVQLQIENVAEGDTFAIFEGLSELPLPNTLLQPLEPRLEILLASGGELISRRGENEVHRISLAGFSAVVPYLRWVAARQDYTVLPRGWPVPNSVAAQDTSGLTQAQSWQSPMPQPHVITQPFPATAPTPTDVAAMGINPDVAEVRGELNILRELLLERHGAMPSGAPDGMSGGAQAPAIQHQQAVQPMAPQPQSVLPIAPVTTVADAQLRIAELQKMAETLQIEISRIQGLISAPAAQAITPAAAPAATAPAMSEGHKVAQHLEYLMTELGLAPDVALMVVQQQQKEAEAMAKPQQDAVITDILQELRAQIPQLEPEQPPAIAPVNQEYQLLSDYFRSVSDQQ